MIQSILRFIINGTLAIILLRILFGIFGGYFGFLFYHLNFSVYYICQLFLDKSSIKLLILTIIYVFIVYLFRKLKSIISL